MTASTVVSLIGLAGALAVYIVIASVKWGRLKEKVRGLAKDADALRNGLYMSNGTLIYVTEEHCNMLREGCTQQTCKKMDEVKAQVVALANKIEKTNERQASEFAKIANFMGKVEAWFENSKGSSGQGASHG